MLPTKNYKYCTKCHVEKTLDEFGDLKAGAGGKQSQCKECLNAKHRESTDLSRRRAVNEVFGQFVTAVRGTKIDVPHISELANEMVKKFRNVEGLATFWYDQLMLAAADEKTSRKVVLDQCYAIAKLVAMSTQNRQTAPDLANMTDDDIDAVIVDAMFKIVPQPSQEELLLIEQAEEVPDAGAA